QADPDYYFGAEMLHQLFPEANIITTPAVQKVIAAKNQDKVAYWAPKMASNAPQTPILPTAYNGNTLQLEGHTIEIRDANSEQSHRPYL
ncbi:hypothetical protein ACJBSS_12000, partial [Streptococcus suis]